MYHEFLKAVTLETAFKDYLEQFEQQQNSKLCQLQESYGQILAKDYPAERDLPGFNRSTVDGYAVSSKVTFGASAQNPVYLPLAGEINMGTIAEFALPLGEVAEISTGGALPEGADSVVMIEQTALLKGNIIEIRSSVTPLENVLRRDDDIACGELLLKKGDKVTSATIGLFAAMGINEIEVVSPILAGIVATGDEIVSNKEETVPPGCVRDVNNPVLTSMLKKAGAVVTDFGIIKDDEKALRKCIRQSVSENNITLISGGSSAGARDFTNKIISELPEGEVIFHGLMVAPGKPTILGKAGKKIIIGLPGNPVSMAVIMRFLVLPLIGRLKGKTLWKPYPVTKVELTEQISSKPGREEFIRVFVDLTVIKPVAKIIRGHSGSIASLSRANGYIHIPLEKEGLPRGYMADFYPLED
jgi:molybdopterin molybdotransferase